MFITRGTEWKVETISEKQEQKRRDTKRRGTECKKKGQEERNEGKWEKGMEEINKIIVLVLRFHSVIEPCESRCDLTP